jgi:nicotinate-nucleotide adenylyltransferase
MKIAVLGGGFNPPHLGHLLICQQVLAFTDIEEVWLLPYFAHPWEKPSISPDDRLAMCKTMESKTIKVSDIEIAQRRKNYTFETIDLITRKYPNHTFSWIIGSDLYEEFFSWEKSLEMVEKVNILVFPRAGWPITKLPANFWTIKDELLTTSDTSSEKIRKMIKEGLSIKGLVLPEVEKYIFDHGLYLT